jgi:predicted molibdopterin-dependent oxidoreductase YjgC
VEWKPPAEVTDADYPFILTTGRILFHYHTGTMTRRSPTLNAEVPTGYVGIPLSTFFHQSTKDTAKLLARFAELTSD